MRYLLSKYNQEDVEQFSGCSLAQLSDLVECLRSAKVASSNERSIYVQCQGGLIPPEQELNAYFSRIGAIQKVYNGVGFFCLTFKSAKPAFQLLVMDRQHIFREQNQIGGPENSQTYHVIVKPRLCKESVLQCEERIFSKFGLRLVLRSSLMYRLSKIDASRADHFLGCILVDESYTAEKIYILCTCHIFQLVELLIRNHGLVLPKYKLINVNIVTEVVDESYPDEDKEKMRPLIEFTPYLTAALEEVLRDA